MNINKPPITSLLAFEPVNVTIGPFGTGPNQPETFSYHLSHATVVVSSANQSAPAGGANPSDPSDNSSAPDPSDPSHPSDPSDPSARSSASEASDPSGKSDPSDPSDDQSGEDEKPAPAASPEAAAPAVPIEQPVVGQEDPAGQGRAGEGGPAGEKPAVPPDPPQPPRPEGAQRTSSPLPVLPQAAADRPADSMPDRPSLEQAAAEPIEHADLAGRTTTPQQPEGPDPPPSDPEAKPARAQRPPRQGRAGQGGTAGSKAPGRSPGPSVDPPEGPRGNSLPPAIEKPAPAVEPAPLAANESGGDPRSAGGETRVPATPAPTDHRGPSTPNRAPAAGPQSNAPAAQEPASVDRVRFVQRVAQAFRWAAGRDRGVRLRLHPPELGSLRLEVAVREGLMTARVEADNPTARTLLLDHLPALRDRLAEHDIRIHRFDVGLMDRPSGGPSHQPGYDLPSQDQPLPGDRAGNAPADIHPQTSRDSHRPAHKGNLDVTV